MEKLILVTVLVLFVQICFAQKSIKNYTDPVAKELSIGTTYTFQPQSVHGNWKVIVRLPKGYENSTNKYPVVYVLHGDLYFNFAVSGLQRLVDFGEMPEAITVGISNESNAYFAFGSDKADQFLGFIENEVFPLVESKYRMHQDRSLLGWHYTAGFAFHALINRPDLFKNYIPASPYLGGVDVNEIEFGSLISKYDKDTSLGNSLSFGVMDNERTVKAAALSLDSLLKLAEPKNLDWQFHRLTPDGDEGIEISAYRLWISGLKTFYAGYKADELVIRNLDEYKSKGGISFVKAHYEKRAESFGGSSQIANMLLLLRLASRANDYPAFKELINELNGDYQGLNLNSVLNYAQFYSSNNKQIEAIAMYENINNYHPNLISVYDGLAQAYFSLGENREAIEAYQMAIELAEAQSDSRWEDLKAKLKAIEN